jgi:hypothetical protein
MKFLTGLIAASALLAQAALACSGSPPPNCSCKNNQWIDNTTNNVYNTTNNTVNGINGSVSAGAGASSNATGGTATATGGNATGGSATNNSTNTQGQAINNSGNQTSTSSASIAKGAVTNNNTVSGGAGGQGGQGGAGGNASISRGAVQNSNVVTGGTSSASIASGAVQNTVGSTSSVSGVAGGAATVGNVSTGASTSSATANGNGSGNGNGNTTDVTYEAAKTYRAPVSTAYSASLTSGMDTCLGSISAGGQTQILGITFGKTVRDKGCDLIKQTHLLLELNQQRAACIRATLDKEGALIREAMKEAGAECPPLVAPVVEVAPAPTPPDAVTHAELRLLEDRITTKVVSK